MLDSLRPQGEEEQDEDEYEEAQEHHAVHENDARPQFVLAPEADTNDHATRHEEAVGAAQGARTSMEGKGWKEVVWVGARVRIQPQYEVGSTSKWEAVIKKDNGISLSILRYLYIWSG
jgi:hypothetical protein